MRCKTAVALVGSIVVLGTIGSREVMAQRPSASLAVSRADADALAVTVTANGGGVSYFGGVFLEFGDGQRQLICRPGSGCRETKVVHHYAQAGTYQMRMVGLGEPEQKPLAEISVTVPLK
jgi:hypothetical protein